MGEGDITPRPGPGPVEPSATDVLANLRQVIEDNKKPEGGGRTWMWSIGLFVLALIGLVIWMWTSRKQNKELAKLRHEREEQRILEEQAMVDRAIVTGDKRVLDLQKNIAEASTRIQEIDKKILAVEASRAEDQLAIDRIRSWRDVDPEFPDAPPGPGPAAGG